MNATETTCLKTAMSILQASISNMPNDDPGEAGAAITRKWSATAGFVAQLAAADSGNVRTARFYVSYGPIASIMKGIWAARFWEVDAPEGEEAVEWVLGSSKPLNDAEDALQLISRTHGLISCFGCS